MKTKTILRAAAFAFVLAAAMPIAAQAYDYRDDYKTEQLKANPYIDQNDPLYDRRHMDEYRYTPSHGTDLQRDNGMGYDGPSYLDPVDRADDNRYNN